ncbi:MAG: hypothetical protein J6D43_18950, partial [Pseudomonas sp.]|nr:hypothetical protein [Pseudomonas sp.]
MSIISAMLERLGVSVPDSKTPCDPGMAGRYVDCIGSCCGSGLARDNGDTVFAALTRCLHREQAR